MTLIKPQERIALAASIGYDSIFQVVSDFYDLIKTHPSLAGPFGSVEDWDAHKIKIAQISLASLIAAIWLADALLIQ